MTYDGLVDPSADYMAGWDGTFGDSYDSTSTDDTTDWSYSGDTVNDSYEEPDADSVGGISSSGVESGPAIREDLYAGDQHANVDSGYSVDVEGLEDGDGSGGSGSDSGGSSTPGGKIAGVPVWMLAVGGVGLVALSSSGGSGGGG